MNQYIPYEKLSKKKQRELDQARRGSWGSLSPVTRKPANPKAYKRQKACRWKQDPSERAFCFVSGVLFSSGFSLVKIPSERRKSRKFSRPGLVGEGGFEDDLECHWQHILWNNVYIF